MHPRLLSFVAFALSAAALQAENWSNWRGPLHNGSSPEKNLPATFSKTEGVKWAVDMPGASAATPVIWGDRVFATAADPKTKKQSALCLDRRTGAQLWRAEISEFTTDGQYSNSCSPSPVTDGKLAVFFFGTGDLVAFDVAGKKLWERNIGPFAFQWTFSASPLLHEGRLILQVLQRDVAVRGNGQPTGNESFLLAIDPATGKDLWRHVRPSDAVAESREAFSTPLPFVHNGRAELVVVGGDAISGHEPTTGRELWRWGTWNPTRIGHWRLVPSPVSKGANVLACAPKGAPVYAVKGGLSGAHTSEDALAWRSRLDDEDMPSKAYKDVSSDVSTPLFYKGHYYILNGEKQRLACVKPETGEVLWHEDLGGRTKIEASPTGADDKIYVMDHRGEVYVVKADPKQFQLLHRVEMMENNTKDLRSTIAVAGSSLYIRTEDTLYCIGQ